MDMSGMSTSATMEMATATSSGAMPTATEHDMGGMGGMGDSCKISVSVLPISSAHETIADVSHLRRCCGTGTPSTLVSDSLLLRHPVTKNSPQHRLHLQQLAHPKQRHVRRLLHWRPATGRSPRSSAPRLSRVRRIHRTFASAESRLVPSSNSIPRRSRRPKQQSLFSPVDHATSPAADFFHPECLSAARQSLLAYGAVRGCVHCDAACDVL
jgi:hypothetical protein